MILLFPNQVGPLVDVQAFLRDLHDDRRESTLLELMRRKDNGSPLDGLADPGPYVALEQLDGVRARFIALADQDARAFSAAELQARLGFKDSQGPIEEKLVVDEVVIERGKMVVAAVKLLAGVFKEDVTEITAEHLGALARSRILTPLWQAVSAFQDLPEKKALRFGLSPAPTSATSTAASAASLSDALAAATVVSSTSTASRTSTPVIVTQPTPALDGT